MYAARTGQKTAQSREYEKLIEEIYADGVVAERVTETRTAYEVSVHTIRKAEGK